MTGTCLKVSVSLPVKGTFFYAAPPWLASLTHVGCRVLVPFNNRQVTGYILEMRNPEEGQELKEILEVLDPVPLFPEAMVPFFEWIADYYLAPLGQVIQSALPGGLNARSYKTAVLTEKGMEALRVLPSDAPERKVLSWVAEHADCPLALPVQEVSPIVKRGLLVVEGRLKRGCARPLLRQFVRTREGARFTSLLEGREDPFRARNEREFLGTLQDGPLSLGEISRRFPNGAYLVNKWIRKGILEKYEAAVYRDPFGEAICPPPAHERLYDQQEAALDRIRGALEKREFTPYLLHGVTGSGKTEVYCRAVEHAVRLGRKAILMVPEIALAHYVEGLLRSRLKDRLAIYHSGLSDGERYDQWMRMAGGEVDLAVGARSALFSPLPQLGLIIVDEEHDAAYKQEGTPRYQARDAAVVRGKFEGAVVVLGSGTPSVQSFQNCLQGRYTLISMPHRVEKRPLPLVEIVDMKTPVKGTSQGEIIGPRLREALQENLLAGNQALLFLNRRGFHRLHLCRSCGQTLRCPNCDVALVQHLQEARLVCHYCGFEAGGVKNCARCGRSEFKAYGFGTEKLEKELRGFFADARIARMDTDSTRRKGEALGILKRFSSREIDILVGTQMITKGYDFPTVTLVGVVAADLSLDFPDFRAAERTFQLMAQTAGRAGRGVQPGRVIIQTFNPSHYAISAATSHDYQAFFEEELMLREQLSYPPFAHLALLRLQGNDERSTEEAALHLAFDIRGLLSKWPEKGAGIQILGPVEAALYRLKGKYRRQILLKSTRISRLNLLLKRIQFSSKKALKSTGVQLTVDMDPYQMS